MSLEGVADAVARVADAAPNIVKAYSSTASGQPGTWPIPQDIPAVPVGKGVALVEHNRFELTHTGKPEVVKHYLTVEIYVPATSAGVAEKSILPLVSELIAAFRLKVGIHGQALQAKITGGGPAFDISVNAKPFLVYPVNVLATEMNVNEYQLGPSS